MKRSRFVEPCRRKRQVQISVNSSVYAVPVYERFGFEACGPRVDAIGLSHVPMRLLLRRGG